MRVNTTKQKLAEGQVVFGGIVPGYTPELVELLALLGYDFVFLDLEHGSMAFDQVEQMVRTAEAYAITPIARIPDHQDATILRTLDRGVQGIIVPHVNTAEQAAQVAAAARYFPDGHRGASSGRAHDYNVHAGRVDTMRWQNEQTLVIPMCEETTAVANLEAILAVPGIDVVHTASNDLGQSMGNPPAAQVREVMLDVVRRVRAAGKYAGVGGNSPSDAAGVAGLIEAGATFVTVSALGLFRLGAEQFRSQVQAAVAAKGQTR